MYIHDTSRIMHARSKKKSWKLGQCQIHVKYPFPPISGPGLEEEKKKREKKIYIGMCFGLCIHTYIYMHARTPFYPSCPLPPPHPSTPILHTTNTNEHIHYAPHTHTHVLLLYTIPHPQTSYLAASLNSRHTYVHTISQRGRSSITDCMYLYIQAQTKPIYV